MAKKAKKKAKYKKTGTRATKTKPVEAEVIKSGKIAFDYIKSNQFRVIHSDGVHGGLAPNAKGLQVAFFSERQPIPRREEHIIKDGRLGQPTKREQRDAIVREVEVEILMDLQTAKSFNKWLEEKIKKLEEIRNAM